jgi:hypothetical protein
MSLWRIWIWFFSTGKVWPMFVIALIISIPLHEFLIAFSDLWLQVELGTGKVSNCSIQNVLGELEHLSRETVIQK